MLRCFFICNSCRIEEDGVFYGMSFIWCGFLKMGFLVFGECWGCRFDYFVSCLKYWVEVVVKFVLVIIKEGF